MIVEFSAASGPRLVDPNDFQRFKLVLVDTDISSIDRGGIQIRGTEALVPIDLVPTLPGAPDDPDWMTLFHKMIEVAARSGWLDADLSAIRAHVERASDG